MSLRNTERSFGTITRAFHWLTALVILSAMPLGLIANRLPYATAEDLARKAELFSIHKTLGVAAFFLGVARILWALLERHPAPLHPDRKPEQALAGAVHWLLYISLIAVPLSGWIHHAAVTGFAPILWPFGQTLPFVPQSETLAAAAASAHWLFTKLMALAILLHILGALKHHLIDRDVTLLRMLRGTLAPQKPQPARRSALPLGIALLIYAVGAGLAMLALPKPTETLSAATATVSPTGGNWLVRDGTLSFNVKQMGAEVTGTFANWTAEIQFDEQPSDGSHGSVTVTIDTASLTLGSVTKQALEPEFFDVASHPTAIFAAAILPGPSGYVATGTLTLRGQERPVTLPFELVIDGDAARMTGEVTLDRRDFGMGASYGDEASVGFAVVVTVELMVERVK